LNWAARWRDIKRAILYFLVILGAAWLGGCKPSVIASQAVAEPTASLEVAARDPITTPQAPSATPILQPELAVSPMPENTATPSAMPTQLPCLEAGGRVENSSLRSDLLRLPMEYRVYLPPCYDQQPELSYPVLYMIHGQNYNEDQWDRLGVDETADALVQAGEVAPFIVVMPRDRNWDQPSQDPFGRVLVEELVPYIDSTYRTKPGRAYRAVGGLSRGAGWAVHLGLTYWDLFGAIGAHSLPVFWSDTAHIREWLEDIPPSSLPRIYLDIGDKDRSQILQSARWFENLLTEMGVPHEWSLFTGYHEEAYWERHVEQYLRWYAREW
jgi:enterochelin esterase-like enzyme